MYMQVLELPSRLFYNTELVSCASFPSQGPKNVPAVRFIGISGQECRDPSSPSYYNDHEADEVKEQVFHDIGITVIRGFYVT